MIILTFNLAKCGISPEVVSVIFPLINIAILTIFFMYNKNYDHLNSVKNHKI